MLFMKFKSNWNAEQFPDDGEVNEFPSETIPDQALTVRQLLDRFQAGKDLMGQPGDFEEEDEDDAFYSIDISKMDLAEREEWLRAAKEEVDRLRAVLNEKAALQREQEAIEAQKKQYEEFKARQEKEQEEARKRPVFKQPEGDGGTN